MIASAQTIRRRQPISPFMERTINNGMTFGLGPAGYDIRAAEEMTIYPGGFSLGSSIEHFDIPLNWLGVVHDKSSWARKGLAVQNTVLEPGWRGFLTLEYTNHSRERIFIHTGDSIAQVVFHILDKPTEQPYRGKYQDQPSGPQGAIYENPDAE